MWARKDSGPLEFSHTGKLKSGIVLGLNQLEQGVGEALLVFGLESERAASAVAQPVRQQASCLVMVGERGGHHDRGGGLCGWVWW